MASSLSSGPDFILTVRTPATIGSLRISVAIPFPFCGLRGGLPKTHASGVAL